MKSVVAVPEYCMSCMRGFDAVRLVNDANLLIANLQTENEKLKLEVENLMSELRTLLEEVHHANA